jgi:hypothetical protein
MRKQKHTLIAQFLGLGDFVQRADQMGLQRVGRTVQLLIGPRRTVSQLLLLANRGRTLRAQNRFGLALTCQTLCD